MQSHVGDLRNVSLVEVVQIAHAKCTYIGTVVSQHPGVEESLEYFPPRGMLLIIPSTTLLKAVLGELLVLC